MKTKLLHSDAERTYAVILEEGDEVMACLMSFAKAERLSAASFKAIGAFQTATLAFFDWSSKTYEPIPVEEQTEVASLTGDIALDDKGAPALHVHAVLGKRDGSAVAGHLQSGLVRPTLEIILTEQPRHLRKRHDPASGLMLIDPDA